MLVRLLTHNHGRVEHPTAWLYRVARNVIIDHYRSRGSRRQSRLDADDLAPAGAAQDPFADDPQAAHRELAGCLRPLVDQLAEPYRSAVSAVDLGGQTHTDVAQAVGISTSGMKSRVQRGRRQLRQLLTDCCRVHTSPTGSISGYEPVTGCHPTPRETTAAGDRVSSPMASDEPPALTDRISHEQPADRRTRRPV